VPHADEANREILKQLHGATLRTAARVANETAIRNEQERLNAHTNLIVAQWSQRCHQIATLGVPANSGGARNTVTFKKPTISKAKLQRSSNVSQPRPGTGTWGAMQVELEVNQSLLRKRLEKEANFTQAQEYRQLLGTKVEAKHPRGMYWCDRCEKFLPPVCVRLNCGIPGKPHCQEVCYRVAVSGIFCKCPMNDQQRYYNTAYKYCYACKRVKTDCENWASPMGCYNPCGRLLKQLQ